MIYGYARVSTKGQQKDGNSLEAQEIQLIEKGASEIIREAYTGTKANRPELDKLLNRLVRGDTLMVTKLDRLARSVSKGMELVKSLQEKGICVHVLNMGKIDDSPTGKLIAQIMFSFSEFERDMIVERTREGKAIAKEKPGFRDGRRPKFSKKQENHAMALLQTNSYKQVAELTGISRATLERMHRRAVL
jgi:DNA invertase Pin-like site-specific DNA recombinase